MIFYFSGTGNSLYVAKCLAAEGEEIVNMADCVKKRQYSFVIKKGENLGFSFPVYFGGLPSVVQIFLNHVRFEGEPEYTFSVITCGANSYGAGNMLKERLAPKNIFLDAVFSIVMPDNYVVMYSIQSEEEEAEILKKADVILKEISQQITERISTKIKPSLMTNLIYPFYAKGRKTKKFWTNDNCVSCGVCAQRCPMDAIQLIDGKVTWVKEQCAHCMACARCNAIQYGKQTVGRRRYAHPSVKKKR